MLVQSPVTKRSSPLLLFVESLVDTPVILAMMHHTHKPNDGVVQKPGSVLKKWNIVLLVNVFYHETVYGLVTCEMNNQAVTEMHNTLLKQCEKSICESVSDGDIAMSDTCSDNSSASESLVRAGNDNTALLAHNDGTSNSIFQRTSSNSCYSRYDNWGSSVYTRPSGSQGNPKGMGDNVATSHSSLRGDNYTRTSGYHGNQAGNVGNASAVKVDQGTRGSFKNPFSKRK